MVDVGGPRQHPGVDVVAVGETMASFVATEDALTYRVIAAGAESNVAIGLARLGYSSRWVSRRGDDPLGELVRATVTAAGVHAEVTVDPIRPTGVMVKHPAGDEKVSSYYRSGSAASALSPRDRARIGAATWIHLTGITPALSVSARDLVEVLLDDPSPCGAVSFDVNYRPSLWPDAGTAASVIVPLARRASLVFVGDDEAMALVGSADPMEIARELAADPSNTVVVKHGSRGATAVADGHGTFVAALPAEVIDTTGAGDAFAAGYLAASCSEWPTTARLRLGHELASRVVSGTEDALGPITAADRAGLTPAGLEERWADDGSQATGGNRVQ